MLLLLLISLVTIIVTLVVPLKTLVVVGPANERHSTVEKQEKDPIARHYRCRAWHLLFVPLVIVLAWVLFLLVGHPTLDLADETRQTGQ